jgi:hypothetical protein
MRVLAHKGRHFYTDTDSAKNSLAQINQILESKERKTNRSSEPLREETKE